MLNSIDIFSHLPCSLQNVVCTFVGWKIYRRRYNSNFFSILAKYENHEYDTHLELKKFLAAAIGSPFWKKRFIEYGIDLRANDIESEIKKLPVLSKAEVKQNLKDLINSQYHGKVFTLHTSGTTGSGLVFPYSVEMENHQWAVWWRYRRMHGLDFNTWCGWFGGKMIFSLHKRKPPYYLINYFLRQIMFSAYHLTPDTVSCYYETIRDKKLSWLHGYPSQLSLLANLICEASLPVLECVKTISFGAENLLENQVASIRHVFPNARLIQHYGLAEGVANISQHPNDELIVDSDFCMLEFLPLSSREPQICRIIGTGFRNPVFPLIRYDTGDLAHIEYTSDGKLLIKSIDGRNEDCIILPSGLRLGRLDHIFKDFPQINEAQIHQISINFIEIFIVRGTTYTKAVEQRLYAEFISRLGTEVKIQFRYCDSIPRTRAGKLKFVISEVK